MIIMFFIFHLVTRVNNEHVSMIMITFTILPTWVRGRRFLLEDKDLVQGITTYHHHQ